MMIRRTARILLLNELHYLLLFKMLDQTFTSKENPNGRACWFTAGGGLEENETYEDAAKRELWEETGLEEVQWGPLVWIREVDILVKGEPTRFIEHYYIARMKGTEIDLNHFTAEEKHGYLSHHWWSLDELHASKELIFPKRLAKLLSPILKGNLPQSPLFIE